MSYNLLKALHLISMVCWFAGCFYIFRLFVYHLQNKNNPQMQTVFETMERKLIRLIMNPAMVFTLVFGIWMIILNPAWMKMGWMHAKLTFVVILIGYHHYAIYVWKRFSKKDFFLSEKTCRLLNEIPTVVLIAAVLLAVLKPF